MWKKTVRKLASRYRGRGRSWKKYKNVENTRAASVRRAVAVAEESCRTQVKSTDTKPTFKIIILMF